MGRKSYALSLFCILSAAITLTGSRALFAPYFLAAVYAIYCLSRDCDLAIDRSSRSYRIIMAVSFILSAFITLANYGLWLHPMMPEIRTPMFVRICKLLLILIIMSGSYASALSILRHAVYHPDAFTLSGKRPTGSLIVKFFLMPFLVISAVYLTVYFCCYYPGLMSLDSMDQVTQIFTGQYSNHQPFYHTMILGGFLRLGLMIFAEINRAVSVYVIFQILFMAFTFAFTVYNMARLEVPVWCTVCAVIFYALMPYHIMFSFTVWKDVLFGAFATLLVIFFVRIMKCIGNSVINHIAFALCGPVICLIRSNGLFAYVFVFLAMLILARKQTKLIVIMAVTIIASFVLKHNVLSALNVTPPDTVESLSIPLQQVARVVADDGNISDEDKALLSKIIDVDSIRDIYDPDISDPVKNAIRDYKNEDHLKQNLGEYGALYLRTLIHNPMEYVIAWVDSTCGYWNSGYNYWVWYWDVEDNDYGIMRQINSESMLTFMDEYLWLFYNNSILQICMAIGLFVWILLLVFARSIATHDTASIIADILFLAILLSLLISSPVYAEFRYMYALFCALPFIVVLVCRSDTGKSACDNEDSQKEA